MDLRDRVPDKALDLLDCREGKFSEWATANAVAMYALNAGFSEGEFVSLVSDSDFAYYFATENGRDRSDRLQQRLWKVWHRAEEDWEPPLGSVADVRRKLSDLQRRVVEQSWPGRSGVTDRAVALALIEYGHSNGAWTLNMSARKLSELTGKGKNTASLSLRRLADTGFLYRQEQQPEEARSAAGWALNLDWKQRSDTIGTHKPLPPSRDYVYQQCVSDHPVFLPRALGPNAGRIWHGLPEHGSVSAADTAELLKLRTETTRRNLNRLVGVGLAEKSSGRPARYSLIPVGPARLDELAEQYGTLDWYERTSETFARHREGYEEFLRQEGRV